jgi:VWFA-related protein
VFRWTKATVSGTVPAFRACPFRFVGAALLLLLLAGQTSQGQVSRSEDENGKSHSSSDSVVTISKTVDEVRLNFTVTDKRGRFVKALKAEDFRLLDNAHPPERITHFQANAESPLRVILLFDISSSIKYRFGFEQKAAIYFLRQVLRPGVDQAAIISLGTEVREVQSMTDDVDQLTAAISRLQPGGNTSLYDAVVRASADLRSRLFPNDARKILIIVSDGADTASHFSDKDCLEAAVLSEATILVVDASIPLERNAPGQLFLRKMAENSGGLVLPARLEGELKGAFHAIAAVIRNQYALSYRPALFRRDGSFRTIQLDARKQHLIVHARTGYYAKLD